MQNEYNFIDPDVLLRMNDLLLMARTVVDGFTTGLHRSAGFGSSIEFAQYRAYVQGDDPRFVDWDLYARTDRLHTKQYQEETNLRCTLLVDCSASMGYASGAVTKFDYARMLAACLAMMLYRQKDAVGLLGFERELKLFISPRYSSQQLRRIFVELNDLVPSGETDIPAALHYAGDVLPLRGVIILISDLFQPPEELLHFLKLLKARRHDVLIFQISDPAEQTFPFEQSMTFLDAENEKELYVVPHSVREEYLKNREQHFSGIQRECLATEIDLEEFCSAEPLDRALHYFLMRRNRTVYAAAGRRNRMAIGGR